MDDGPPGQTLPPAISEAREQHPEDAIDRMKPRAMPLLNQARKLMAQRHILGDEISAILEDGVNACRMRPEHQREIEAGYT